MNGKNKQAAQNRAATTCRNGWWIAGVILLTLVVTMDCRILENNAAAAEPDPSRLIGRWLRPDGGYLLELSDPAPDGRLKAAYFNPRPINVSRAQWQLKDSYVVVLVELSDVNYEGSTYLLAYDPDTDQLAGIYFQATLKQRFEVVFQRTKPK
jgi:hypothetical protein